MYGIKDLSDGSMSHLRKNMFKRSSSFLALRLTFADVNGVDDIKFRTLHLTQNQTVTIGRASRKETKKDTLASKENGYINSPVISRTHAELSLAVSRMVCTASQ